MSGNKETLSIGGSNFYLYIDGYIIESEILGSGPNKGEYLAWLPAFGKSVCSVVVEHSYEIMSELKKVYQDVKNHFESEDYEMPAKENHIFQTMSDLGLIGNRK
jgi:hypothetical protein